MSIINQQIACGMPVWGDNNIKHKKGGAIPWDQNRTYSQNKLIYMK